MIRKEFTYLTHLPEAGILHFRYHINTCLDQWMLFINKDAACKYIKVVINDIITPEAGLLAATLSLENFL